MSLENGAKIGFDKSSAGWSNELLKSDSKGMLTDKEAKFKMTNTAANTLNWVYRHPRLTTTAIMAGSLAIGALRELSHPDITSALQDPIYPSCDTIPGAVPQPDQTHGIYGGVCQIQSTPQHYYIDGSQLSMPSEVPAATSTTYSQSTVVYEDPASNTPASPLSTPYIPVSDTDNSGGGAIIALALGGSIAGLALFRGFLRRSFGTYQSPQEAYDEGVKKGIVLGGVVKKESETALAKQLEKERKKALKRRGIR